MFCCMAKRMSNLLQIQCADYRPVSYAAESNDDASLIQHRKFPAQVGIAVPDLASYRLVLWGQAFHRIGDAAINEFKSIISRQGLGCTGKTMFMQGPVQQETCMVTSERPAARVRAMHAGGQPHNQ